MRWIGHTLIRQALAELADEDFQTRLWTGKIEGMMGSLSEAHSSLFDDSALGLALDKEEPVYSESLDARLRDLGSLLERLDVTETPEATLSDPVMQEVRSQTASILFELVRSEPLTEDG